MNKPPKKERIHLPLVPMREQEPLVRRQNFDEVPLGYNAEEAIREAFRCLECPGAPCIEGCPVKVDIKSFIQLLSEGKFQEALAKIRETNALPAICGRVCPQETQCQEKCQMGKVKGQKPVAIGRLERFVADHAMNQNQLEIPGKVAPRGKKVGIIGAGPAGLTAAGELALRGYEVTVFEAFSGPGGVLLYGIPEFRLPKRIIGWEVNYLAKLGVRFEYNCLVGKTITIPELFSEGFEAFFVGTGAGLPHFMGIPGEDFVGVFSANEFLTRSNMMRAFDFPNFDTPLLTGKKAIVIGGGNVAMDSARTALRLGFEVRIIYRRSWEEMPARHEEIHHAEEEGVLFELLTLPIRYIDDGKGRLKAVECLRMKLGEPDKSGRRSPVPIEGSQFVLELDMAIVAIGSGANPILVRTTPGLEIDKKGHILIDSETGLSSLQGVYAGGDIVTGSATVIEAMGAGKKAAAAIDRYLSVSCP